MSVPTNVLVDLLQFGRPSSAAGYQEKAWEPPEGVWRAWGLILGSCWACMEWKTASKPDMGQKKENQMENSPQLDGQKWPRKNGIPPWELIFGLFFCLGARFSTIPPHFRLFGRFLHSIQARHDPFWSQLGAQLWDMGPLRLSCPKEHRPWETGEALLLTVQGFLAYSWTSLLTVHWCAY